MAEGIEPLVERAGRLIASRLRGGGKVLVCGNGGSAADAQHFVAELVGRLRVERAPLAAVALSSDTSVVTALGNDYGFEAVFARQVEGLGRKGDVLVAITTSGASANVLGALEAARSKGMAAVVLTGEDPASTLTGADCCFTVPSRNTQRIQELHMAILHALCERVEREQPQDAAGT